GDTNFRRTWDLDEFRRRANERELAARDEDKNDERRKLGLRAIKKKDEEVEERTLLKQREDEIDFSKVVNTTQVINASSGEQAGFFCKVCNTVAKDNASYLDHINGRKHQRNLGMSMKVEKSTAEQVKARLETLNKRKAEGLEARIKKAKEEEEEAKRRKKEEKRKKKQTKKEQPAPEEQEDSNTDMAALMGF
ncbi:hypothetical protein HK405_002069, partial [Cladochytrium tenue]